MIYLAISVALTGFLVWRALDKSKNHRAQFWLSVGLLFLGSLIFGVAIFYERQAEGMDGIYYAVVAGLTFWILILPSAGSLVALYVRRRSIFKDENIYR